MSEAYVLVTLPFATLTSSPTSDGPTTFAGQLALEYVTFNIPSVNAASTTPTRDVLLVLRIDNGAFEAPLDPQRALTVSVLPPSGARRYVFHATTDDAEFTVELPPVTPENADNVDLFHSVLVGYAADPSALGEAPTGTSTRGGGADQIVNAPPAAEVARADEDLRGRFVLMNEDNGEIVGALDGSIRVREDPSLGEKGHEQDPVVVELPEDADALDDLGEVLVRTIPPEDRDWMLKGAVFISHAISGTTTLLTSAMTTASNYYIAHSTHAAPLPSSSGTSTAPDAPPSRTLLLLQSPTTRKHLTRIHTVSGGAVKLSHRAAAAVESLIQRTVADADKPPLPLRGRSPSPAAAAARSPDDKPPLPPRYSKPSLSPSPSPSRSPSPKFSPLSPQSRSSTPSQSNAAPLRTRTRVALSAAIILSSLAESSVRLVDAGGAAVAAAVSSKYGATAGDNVLLATGTMRNVVLVYTDMRGLGRRAIVRRTAKSWVKGRVAKAREEAAGSRK
ncbi:hypothetical protein F5148DRAFT_1274310 [Russula earlei]|uniref:Uncharacterized protein n=1 Tax=Russula earlei TaxID=71964 RepID=A0ACC0UI81_9AGAM|nr:hypothetical protein F5148DRAFT_1274310 [Russula earlei]